MTRNEASRAVVRHDPAQATNRSPRGPQSTAGGSLGRPRRPREAFPSRNLRQLLRAGLLRFFLGLSAADGGPR